MDVQTPETPGRLSLRLDVYSPPQVLQIDGRLCHLVLAFPIERDITNRRAPSLRGSYSASSLLRTHPPPSRLRSTSRLGRLVPQRALAVLVADHGAQAHTTGGSPLAAGADARSALDRRCVRLADSAGAD